MGKGPFSSKMLLAIVLGLTMSPSALAARLLKATVVLDGKVVMHSAYTDNDWVQNEDAATAWRYLGKEPEWVENEVLVRPEAADPLQAKLRGSLVIRIQHTDCRIVEGKATELALIRTGRSSTKWFLPGEEVERLAQANGIPSVPSPPSLFERVGVLLAILAAVWATVACVSVWLVIRAQRVPCGT